MIIYSTEIVLIVYKEHVSTNDLSCLTGCLMMIYSV